ncbi:unnamed protein product [Rhizophagus irregularis]|nr:unnamed protein product [Rhizophagus irregularis]
MCTQDSLLDCSFQVIKDHSADLIFSRCLALTELAETSNPSPSLELLLGSCPSQRLLVVSLCTGVPLLVDPVSFWHNFSDMRMLFEIFGLSRFEPLRSSYFYIDWTLTFDILKETLYHRLDVSRISTSYRFQLQL